MKTYTVFYSWQFDLRQDTNLIAIRDSIRKASTLIESEIENIKIETDEATRDMTGSENIIESIFNKIDLLRKS